VGSPNISIIVNPNAGNGSTGKKWPKIKALAQDRLGPFQEYITTGPGDGKKLTAEAVAKGTELVVCIGGDGTLNEVINGIMEYGSDTQSDVVLGFIPDGTGCDFVRTVAIPRNIAQAIDVISEYHVCSIDLGRVFFKDHTGNDCCRYFHNVTSFGLGGEVDQRVNNTTKFFGPFLSFIWATLISIFLYGKKKIYLKIDDTVANEFTIWNVAVANGQYFGGGMQIAPDASIDDGLFDVTIVGDLKLPEIFINLPKLYNGKIKTVEKVAAFTGKQIVATSDQHVLLDVDGEQPGTLPVTLDMLPGALNVITAK
jgi:YegS/Rv2252/BmrU family lipid kinase